jgi:steroid delta-isomerase-like uncharacterized protein
MATASTTARAADIARQHYDLYNAQDLDRAATSLIAEDAEWVNVATGETFRGPDGYRRFIQGWRSAFPGSRIDDLRIEGNDDVIVAEFRGRGTHAGPLATPAGMLPPTGRVIDVPFCEVMEVREGRISRARLYFDSATLMRQLGVLPEPSATSPG